MMDPVNDTPVSEEQKTAEVTNEVLSEAKPAGIVYPEGDTQRNREAPSGAGYADYIAQKESTPVVIPIEEVDRTEPTAEDQGNKRLDFSGAMKGEHKDFKPFTDK
jgi:hypothetical protein